MASKLIRFAIFSSLASVAMTTVIPRNQFFCLVLCFTQLYSCMKNKENWWICVARSLYKFFDSYMDSILYIRWMRRRKMTLSFDLFIVGLFRRFEYQQNINSIYYWFLRTYMSIFNFLHLLENTWFLIKWLDVYVKSVITSLRVN